MSRQHSFKLTLSNNVTEKQGINYLIEEQTGFFKLDKDTKKELLDRVNIPHRFLQSFDMVYIPKMKGIEFEKGYIETHLDEILFIELRVCFGI
jgi:hypothetical protein